MIEDLNKKGFGIHSLVIAYDYASMHQQQTILLTSWLYSIPLFMYGDRTATEATITTILKNPYFSGKTVLLCWEHDCIQSLVKYITNDWDKIERFR